MQRGDIWTVSGGPGHAGKPRPVVIIQDDRFDATATLTICAVTSDPTDAPLFRPAITPTATRAFSDQSGSAARQSLLG